MVQIVKPSPDDWQHLPGLSILDVGLDTDAANVAKIILDKHYPEEGYRACNTGCEMIVTILNGAVLLVCGGKKFSLQAGDFVLVKKGGEYSWTPEASVHLLIFSTPPWNPEQQVLVPE